MVDAGASAQPLAGAGQGVLNPAAVYHRSAFTTIDAAPPPGSSDWPVRTQLEPEKTAGTSLSQDLQTRPDTE